MTIMKTTNVKKNCSLYTCQVRHATSADVLRFRKLSRTTYPDTVNEMAAAVEEEFIFRTKTKHKDE